MKNILIDNIDKIHSTELGFIRIKKNLSLDDIDILSYIKNIIKDDDSFVCKNGKNYYVKYQNIIITINSYSYTIITAHKEK